MYGSYTRDFYLERVKYLQKSPAETCLQGQVDCNLLRYYVDLGPCLCSCLNLILIVFYLCLCVCVANAQPPKTLNKEIRTG